MKEILGFFLIYFFVFWVASPFLFFLRGLTLLSNKKIPAYIFAVKMSHIFIGAILFFIGIIVGFIAVIDWCFS